jgi:hypothetical protein
VLATGSHVGGPQWPPVRGGDDLDVPAVMTEADCADGVFYSTWTISGCTDDRCAITLPEWAIPTVLTRTQSGTWTSASARAADYSATCDGQPVPTFDTVELTVRFEDGVTTLQGTLHSAANGSATYSRPTPPRQLPTLQ